MSSKRCFPLNQFAWCEVALRVGRKVCQVVDEPRASPRHVHPRNDRPEEGALPCRYAADWCNADRCHRPVCAPAKWHRITHMPSVADASPANHRASEAQAELARGGSRSGQRRAGPVTAANPPHAPGGGHRKVVGATVLAPALASAKQAPARACAKRLSAESPPADLRNPLGPSTGVLEHAGGAQDRPVRYAKTA